MIFFFLYYMSILEGKHTTYKDYGDPKKSIIHLWFILKSKKPQSSYRCLPPHIINVYRLILECEEPKHATIRFAIPSKICKFYHFELWRIHPKFTLRILISIFYSLTITLKIFKKQSNDDTSRLLLKP